MTAAVTVARGGAMGSPEEQLSCELRTDSQARITHKMQGAVPLAARHLTGDTGPKLRWSADTVSSGTVLLHVHSVLMTSGRKS